MELKTICTSGSLCIKEHSHKQPQNVLVLMSHDILVKNQETTKYHIQVYCKKNGLECLNKIDFLTAIYSYVDIFLYNFYRIH